MKRRAPIKRGPFRPKRKRKTPAKAAAKRARDSEKKAREFARAYGSSERVEWTKAQPSAVSGKGPCVNAHVRTGGLQRKADYQWIVPLTDAEHHELDHTLGRRAFERKYECDLDGLAAEHEHEWQQRQQRCTTTGDYTP